MLNKQKSVLSQNTKIEELALNQELFDEAKKAAGEAIFSAYELLQLAKKQNGSYEGLIGSTKKIDGNISSISDLVGKLNEYVGANGKYTPITRNTTLCLDIPTLKNIELVS